MAKEFFELWRENSIIKKIVAVLLITGAVAAALVSIFSLKEMVAGDKKKDGSIVVSGNGNAIGSATINNDSHNFVIYTTTDAHSRDGEE
jgi:hypothetical protein